MSKQTVKSQHDTKKHQKNKPGILTEQTEERVNLAGLPYSLIGSAGDTSIQAQAVRLGDTRFQVVQRQAMATQIGRVRGNHYLQRVMSQMNQDEQPLSEAVNQEKAASAIQREDETPRGQVETSEGIQPLRPRSANLKQTIQSSSVGGTVQLAQHPAAARQSRIAVATSVHSFRTTYPNTRGGQLTQRLRRQLRDRRRSVAAAVGEVGEGSRTFGARPASGEERAGLTLGTSATATNAVTRRAVVVGNGDYDDTRTMGSTVEPLRDIAEAVSEAGAMASTLRRRGYDVRHQDDRTAPQIDALLQAGIAGLGAGDELVFYYHGHGTLEGLIGQDGSVYTPTQMTALRSTARGAQVDLTLALEGCHTGVFADAIRGAELRDTRTAMRARVGATSGMVQYARQLLLPVLDNAISIQGQKDAFNTRAQAWWARRYQIEQQMAASPGNATLTTAWNTHYNTLQGIWNNLVTAVTPLLLTLRTNAIAAGFNVQLSPQITPLSGTFNQTGEQAIQAGLDDLDTILNRVLQETDSRLR